MSDMPSGPGTWAFEGTIDAGEGATSGRYIQSVCKVFMFYGSLTAWILEKGIWSLRNMHGIWTRVYMPWESPAPSPAPMPDEVRETLRDILHIERDKLSAEISWWPNGSAYPDRLKREIDDIDAALTWLDYQMAQEPQPDWSQAPEWAMWWAIEEDGYAVWFEHKPVADDEDGWIHRNVFSKAKRAEPRINPDWRTTLRQRPQEAE